MGMFLALSGVIGKSQSVVAASLANYAKSAGGGLRVADGAMIAEEPCCTIQSANGNTTVVYPYDYLEWDKSSRFLSDQLQAPVFSFHIHDGDLWMYVLYSNGEAIDQFNPVPDYWEKDLSEDEAMSWQGNATAVAGIIPGLNPADVEKYLARWNLADVSPGKAYPDDAYTYEDWQLLDFLRKTGLPYPLDEDGNPKGQVYKLWTETSD